ncbi:hypothetical protein [Acidovorax sp. sic0104]|uniref:hypothetical protein n=1 Tax=Acidovorax sp. sic0104 TaxID=2854784 RepID=UPI001C454026|nr:hypothetical protein [Acidovorax sp. sic0104]MBV7539796.1 hypothetical protein [Acidovorax sp. sic0104]
MAINWFRWFGGRSRREIESQFFPDSADADVPPLTPREQMLNAALRDAAVIHGAGKDWIRAELVEVSSAAEASWDVRLVVSGSEMDVWERAEAFQSTFLQQLCVLGEGLGERLPVVTWKFTSQEVVMPLRHRSAAANDAVVVRVASVARPQPARRGGSPDRERSREDQKRVVGQKFGIAGELIV